MFLGLYYRPRGSAVGLGAGVWALPFLALAWLAAWTLHALFWLTLTLSLWGWSLVFWAWALVLWLLAGACAMIAVARAPVGTTPAQWPRSARFLGRATVWLDRSSEDFAAAGNWLRSLACRL